MIKPAEATGTLKQPTIVDKVEMLRSTTQIHLKH